MASHHEEEGKNRTSWQQMSAWGTNQQGRQWHPGQWHHGQWCDGQWHHEMQHHEKWHHRQSRSAHVRWHPGKGYDPTQGNSCDSGLCFSPFTCPREVYEQHLAKRRGKSLQSSMQEQDEWIRKSNGDHYDKETLITCPWPGPMKLSSPEGSSLGEAMGWSNFMAMKTESFGRLCVKCAPAAPLEDTYGSEEILNIAPAGRYYQKQATHAGSLKEYWFTISINTNIPISAGHQPMDITTLMHETIQNCAARPSIY